MVSISLGKEGQMSNQRRCPGQLTNILDYSCADIEADVEITETELLTWNPWLAGDCDTELYTNLDSSDYRAVCIGIDVSATTTISSTSTAPTPTDTIAGCQEFYTIVSGDSCSTIQAKFAITFAEFYGWNPSSMYLTTTVNE